MPWPTHLLHKASSRLGNGEASRQRVSPNGKLSIDWEDNSDRFAATFPWTRAPSALASSLRPPAPNQWQVRMPCVAHAHFWDPSHSLGPYFLPRDPSAGGGRVSEYLWPPECCQSTEVGGWQ